MGFLLLSRIRNVLRGFSINIFQDFAISSNVGPKENWDGAPINGPQESSIQRCCRACQTLMQYVKLIIFKFTSRCFNWSNLKAFQMRRTLTNKNENIRIYNKEVAIPKKKVKNTKSIKIPIKKPFLTGTCHFGLKNLDPLFRTCLKNVTHSYANIMKTIPIISQSKWYSKNTKIIIIHILHFLCQKISILHIFHTFTSNGTFSLLILVLPSNNFATFSQNGNHGSLYRQSPPPPINSINNRMFANLHKDGIDDIYTKKVASEFVERSERRKCYFGKFYVYLLD